ncbi:carbonic anhydrase family protein [Listeria costaricensis]|uniref:carbonic anhydrase family protein n=1 Tax=Listeria costaricensis TaxID=2026604 RepID=UPI000C08B8B8|nr:carbonic anhydrase family protein [Listeria costaricensis]
MPAVNVSWSYHGETGPENWGTICPEFAVAKEGTAQSPIDLQLEHVAKYHGELLQFYYEKMTYTVKRIENSVHLFPLDNTQYLMYNEEKYTLAAFHAHIPSEHLLNGKKFDIEWHFVHENVQGDKLVLAVWMHVDQNSQAALGELPRYFQEVFVDFDTERSISLEVERFLPKRKAFYTYQGSLTTPPTVEGVTWVILKEAVAIDGQDLEKLDTVIGETNRPVQPLNGREISFYS